MTINELLSIEHGNKRMEAVLTSDNQSEIYRKLALSRSIEEDNQILASQYTQLENTVAIQEETISKQSKRIRFLQSELESWGCSSAKIFSRMERMASSIR